MSTIATLFTRDHRHADDGFAAVEAALLTGPTASALDAWKALEAELLHHFLVEEEALFPAFEATTGMSSGPTEVMRLEHAQIRELFAPLGSIRTRAMFGGWGFYCDDLFFAIIADETLYLKADAETAARFEAAGGEPFRFSYKDGRTETMNYWTVPEEAMESPGEMTEWAQLALAAAIRARRPPAKAPRKKQPE